MDPEWKFAHVGMVVKNLQKTVEKMQALGLISVPDTAPVSLPGKAPDRADGTGSILRLDIRCGELCIELLQPESGDNIQQRWLDAHGEGISHVCFEVPDIDRARTKMATQGVPVLCHIHGTTTYYETGAPGSLQIEVRQAAGEE